MNNYSRKSVSYVDSGARILYLRAKCSKDEKIKFIGYVPTIVRKSSWDRVIEFMDRVFRLYPKESLRSNPIMLKSLRSSGRH